MAAKPVHFGAPKVPRLGGAGGRTGPEAVWWLTLNHRSKLIASDRFTRRGAWVFVKALYDKGADFVEVGSILKEPGRAKEEAGPCTDTLYVHVPKNANGKVVARAKGHEDYEFQFADPVSPEHGWSTFVGPAEQKRYGFRFLDLNGMEFDGDEVTEVRPGVFRLSWQAQSR